MQYPEEHEHGNVVKKRIADIDDTAQGVDENQQVALVDFRRDRPNNGPHGQGNAEKHTGQKPHDHAGRTEMGGVGGHEGIDRKVGQRQSDLAEKHTDKILVPDPV